MTAKSDAEDELIVIHLCLDALRVPRKGVLDSESEKEWDIVDRIMYLQKQHISQLELLKREMSKDN